MDTPRIEATPEESTAGYRRWAKGLGASDRKRAAAYRLLHKGAHLIDLFECLRRAGHDRQGRPNLAIARALATRVQCSIVGDEVAFESIDAEGEFMAKAVSVPFAELKIKGDFFYGTATVPSIPPDIRPRKLARYWILFEASWKTVTKDPLLLRHVFGALYHVVAAWDLTPLERACLRGT